MIMDSFVEKNFRSAFDKELISIVDYVLNFKIESEEAYETAGLCLLDSLGCGILALNYPACTKLLGPVVPETIVPQGVRVPGTNYVLDPQLAAFNIGTMIRWLDFNDTWLASEWGHPSDNLGGILAISDFLSQRQKKLVIRDVLSALIKAYEIQGIFALENSFNRVGLDHVILVKLATTAVVAQLLECNREQILNALSLVFVDGQSLRTYRHAPNTGTRKSWAAGDATCRGVFLAMLAKKGEMGYPSALTAKTWGFYDVLFQGKPFQFSRDFNSYVMENILFKIKFPADRDHCLQYMVGVALLKGDLKAEDYEELASADPRIDVLREKMKIQENKQFTQDYLNPEKRSIANAIQIIFKGGSSTENITVMYPLGHRRRRAEGLPLLLKKFEKNMLTRFPLTRVERFMALFMDTERFLEMPVRELMASLTHAKGASKN